MRLFLHIHIFFLRRLFNIFFHLLIIIINIIICFILLLPRQEPAVKILKLNSTFFKIFNTETYQIMILLNVEHLHVCFDYRVAAVRYRIPELCFLCCWLCFL